MSLMSVPCQDRDVLDLCSNRFPGTTKLSKNNVTHPLPPGALYEQISPPFNSSLLKLPSELLALVLEQLSGDDLAILALVNTVCRQLARSVQFSSIVLDFSPKAIDCLDLLRKESRERQANNGRTLKPTLGTCIRHITVFTNPVWLRTYFGIDLSENWLGYSDEVADAKLSMANRLYYGMYIGHLATVLSDVATLPNISSLNWEDNVTLPQYFLNSLAMLNLKDLKLTLPYINEDFVLDVPRGHTWPLRSLHLELEPARVSENTALTSALSASILRASAPTLEILTWKSIGTCWAHTCLAEKGEMPPFPNLRKVILEGHRFSNTSFLEWLFQDGLSTLELICCEGPQLHSFLRNRGQVRTLTAFTWHERRDSDSLDAFLAANPQLVKLALTDSLRGTTPYNVYETRVLPRLSAFFSSLHSLSLCFDGRGIPVAALKQISSLTSLQQICLTAGHQHGRRREWLIDHDEMRYYLPSLPNLKKIAFMRDTYRRPIDWMANGDNYYELRWLPDGPRNPQKNARAWEQGHRKFILKEADKYAGVLPSIELLYFGQLLMAIKERYNTPLIDRVSHANLPKRPAIALSRKRDDDYTALKSMLDI